MEPGDTMSLQKHINENNRIMLLTGAGVSTGSGLPDFRSSEGLYADYENDPVVILSRSTFNQNPEVTLQYILDNFIMSDKVKPNLAHQFAKDLDDEGKLMGVVTQNVDGLYQRTGLDKDKIIEIHGNGNTFFCDVCRSTLDHTQVSEDYKSECCNGTVDTDVILYGDNFDMDRFQQYQRWVERADLIIVMGTTLNIQAHLMNVAQHDNVILINNERVRTMGMNIFCDEYIGDINEILETYYQEKDK